MHVTISSIYIFSFLVTASVLVLTCDNLYNIDQLMLILQIYTWKGPIRDQNVCIVL